MKTVSQRVAWTTATLGWLLMAAVVGARQDELPRARHTAALDHHDRPRALEGYAPECCQWICPDEPPPGDDYYYGGGGGGSDKGSDKGPKHGKKGHKHDKDHSYKKSKDKGHHYKMSEGYWRHLMSKGRYEYPSPEYYGDGCYQDCSACGGYMPPPPPYGPPPPPYGPPPPPYGYP